MGYGSLCWVLWPRVGYGREPINGVCAEQSEVGRGGYGKYILSNHESGQRNGKSVRCYGENVVKYHVKC